LLLEFLRTSNDLCVDTMTIVTLFRIIELAFIAFTIIRYARNTLAACAHRTPSCFMYMTVYVLAPALRRLHRSSTAPRCTLSENTLLLGYYPAFRRNPIPPPVPSGEITLVHPSPIPVTRPDTSRHRWRWFYPENVGVSAIKIYKMALLRFVYNRNFIRWLSRNCFPRGNKSRYLLLPITQLRALSLFLKITSDMFGFLVWKVHIYICGFREKKGF